VRLDPRGELELEPVPDRLPEAWSSDQAYTAGILTSPEGKKVILLLFADASQMDGEMRVWLKGEER
jgi:hypothetical protein